MSQQEEAVESSEPFDSSQWAPATAKRKKRKKKKGEDSLSLNINSLMDIMTIMLVFLLKQYGEDPLKVQGEDLKTPNSIAQLTPEDATTITISQKAILVNDKQAVKVNDGAVDQSQKKGGESSLMIQPLFDELQQAVKKKKQESQILRAEYQPMATVIADQGTPYRLVQEVMYTAGQAELSQFKLAIIKTNRDQLGK
jgi:biopolymer transport protein ExbD